MGLAQSAIAAGGMMSNMPGGSVFSQVAGSGYAFGAGVGALSSSLSCLLATASALYRIHNLNDYLKYGKTLDPSDAIHARILEYINNSQEDIHRFGIQVKQIISIERKNNHGFCELLREGKTRMMLWHGTSVDNLSSIIKNGFELPPPDKTGLLQGRGIYFADRASKSARYCDDQRRPSPGQDGILILCEVIVGRSYISTTSHHNWTSPPGVFDSVTCPGQRTPSPSQYKRVDGVVFPSGVSRDNQEHFNCLVNFNEYVVYDPDQVDVKYVVTFTFTRNKHHNANIAQQQQQQDFYNFFLNKQDKDN